jgi:hypothetical protein
MTPVFTTLKKIPYVLLTLGLTSGFWVLYTLFDLRQGGTHLTIFSTHLEPFQYFVAHFGGTYVALRVTLDFLISLLSAVLISLTIDQYRNGNRFLTSSVCSTGGTLLFGFAVFGCPSCVLPIAGTFGVIFSSSTLPLFGFEFKIIALLLILGTLLWLLRRLKLALPPGLLAKEQKKSFL